MSAANVSPVNELTFRICYADTDAGGVVYYGNYLRFLEQGRTALLRQMGWKIEELHRDGIIFPVHELNVLYKSPATLGEEIRVRTHLVEINRFSLRFRTEIESIQTDRILVQAQVTNACINEAGKIQKIPDAMREVLEKALNGKSDATS
ncbi:MAG TPA: thioesterase family protein [bacterium]|nr:thioesterase family protein [bacterium]